ncbi:hypothetical protein M3Y97_00061400 [Aphelenchoides bicaudatus]|nr:hypothetical protein M3Y97_00061400 [Aphelenchoides bicaudatus]
MFKICFRSLSSALNLRHLKYAIGLRKMKIDTPEFQELFTPELRYVSDLFKRENHELRIAGGPVRDLIMGIKPADIDFATTATPTEMKELFDREQIRMLNKRGEEHGTITCRINDKENFEITTLRIDEVCDGRRAKVIFTTDWEIDAFRRDLTINSLFLDLDGVVYDYTGGIEDIKKRRVAFVGNAVERIQEDYLRILRYFRFFGRIANTPDQHEKETIEAIVKCRDGINHISAERIWTELHKIVIGRMAPDIVRTMFNECGLAELLAFNDEFTRKQLDVFERVYNSVTELSTPDEKRLPCTMTSCFLSSLEDVDRFLKRTKFSNAERTLSEFLVENRDEAEKNSNNLLFFKVLYANTTYEAGPESEAPVRRCTIELLKYVNAADTLKEFREWVTTVEKFSVGGIDLLNAGIPKGPSIKNTISYLHQIWVKSDFKTTKGQLLEHAKNDPIPQPSPKKKAKKRRWVDIQ